MIKEPKKVTVKSEVVCSLTGKIILQKGKKYKVRELEKTGGFWSRICPDIYIPETVSCVKLVGIYGSWFANNFSEFDE